MPPTAFLNGGGAYNIKKRCPVVLQLGFAVARVQTERLARRWQLCRRTPTYGRCGCLIAITMRLWCRDKMQLLVMTTAWCCGYCLWLMHLEALPTGAEIWDRDKPAGSRMTENCMGTTFYNPHFTSFHLPPLTVTSFLIPTPSPHTTSFIAPFILLNGSKMITNLHTCLRASGGLDISIK